MQERGADGGALEPSREHAEVGGVDDWMWGWQEWRQMAPGEPCLAGLMYSMDPRAGTSCARLLENQRARRDVVEAARGGGADERPLAPFPPGTETPPAVIVAGGEGEVVQGAEIVGNEEAHGRAESAPALM